MNEISKKKIHYPIKEHLRKYLEEYSRENPLPIKYEDLNHYENSISLYDDAGRDTMWETVFYSQNDMSEIHSALSSVYALLKTEGDTEVMEHLYVNRIDFCPFGNSKPFRIRVTNRYNDNYDYFYVKKADSSRIYGLELEHILSPNRIFYIVDGNTIVEDHIAGIPGDVFIKSWLEDPQLNKIRLAKEFVKFNERCFVRLLGDMRSYNYVVDVTPDFDAVQYRIRAIDFDQQTYEGNKTMYLPQYFKDNNPIVDFVSNLLESKTIRQYQKEERAMIANRIRVSRYRLKDLSDCLDNDTISPPEKVNQLKHELAEHFEDQTFLECQSMGDILRTRLYNLMYDNRKVLAGYD
ncbi:MAG: hypothetical protein QMC40_03315 [Vicingaceae bacterium]|jgi:hypothetical protein|tara:strand:+ start:1181 stop:2230 length:1050 start_codon:yes stop_codon:yes gene_type:complete